MNVHEFQAALSIRPTPTDLDALTAFLHGKVTETGEVETIETANGPVKVPLFDGADCHTVEYATKTLDDGSVRLFLTVAWETDPTPIMQSQVVAGIKRKLDQAAIVAHTPPAKPVQATDEELSGKSTRQD